MKPVSISMAILGLSLLTLSGVNAQSTITEWTFDNLTVATNSSPSPSIGSGTAASLGMGLINGPDKSDITTAQGFDTNNTSTTNQVWRLRGNNGWNSTEPIGSQGAQFFINTTGFISINLSFDILITAQGEANFQVDFTTNGGSTWLNGSGLSITGTAETTNGTSMIADYITNNSANPNIVNGTYIHTDATNDSWIDGVTLSLTNLPSVNNNANFGFEIVDAATGSSDVALKTNALLNNTSGNWRFDNVTVTGTSSVPEPSTYALFVGGTVILAGFLHRRKKA